MPPMGKDMLKDKGNRKPSASTGHETSDTEDPSGRGNMPGQMRHRDHVDGAMPQPPAIGSNASTVKTPGRSPKVGKEQEGGDGVDNENSMSRILDKISSFTYDQWVIAVLACLCAYCIFKIQTLNDSSKSTDASSSMVLDESVNIKSVNSELAYLKQRLESLDNDRIRDLELLKEEIEQFREEMVPQRHYLTSELRKIIDNQSRATEDMGKKLQDLETKTNQQMLGIDGKLDGYDKNFTALNESLGSIKETTNNLAKELVSLKERIANSANDMQVKAEEMHKKLANADTELEKFQTRITTMTDKLAIHDRDLDTAFSNLFNKEAAIIVIVLILTMNIGLVCAVYVLCKGRNRTGGASANATNRNVNGDTYYNPVLNRVPRESVLRKAVGVISFSQQHQHLHRRLVESLKDGIRGPIDVVYHVILRDEDIVNIPRCSLIIICIEYSARDVIIERSGFGLGDFNKTTLQAVQQLGAIPVIVYDYDNRSQRLGENEIFSQQIGCATRQEELIPLSRANRFYSVYDSFSAHQKQVLQEIIQAHVLNLARF